MEYPQNLLQQGIKFSILGDCVIQIVLLPGEQITTRRNYVQYYSDNIEITTKNNYFLFDNQVRVHNNSKENASYVGVSAQIGKVMTIDAALFNNYLIKENQIVASSDCLDNASFVHLEASYQKISFSKELMKQQIIFLQTNGVVIDKDLGEGESIIIPRNSILVMQDFVRYELLKEPNRVKFMGPGRIIFEINQSQTVNQVDIMKRKSLANFLMWISLVFLLLFLDIFFELNIYV